MDFIRLLCLLACNQISSLLILDYRFNQNFGQVFYDYSGLGNHGQNGESHLNTLGDTLPTDRGAYFSSSFSDYIMAPPNSFVSSSFNLGSTFSILFWCMSFDSANYMLTYRSSDIGFLLNVERKKANNQLHIKLNQPGFSTQNAVGNKKVDNGKCYIGKWIFLSFINKGAIIDFYVNGKISLSIDQLVDYSEIGNYNHYIGYFTGSFEGFMWYYKIFNESIINSDFYLDSYSGGNCILALCHNSCSPALNQDGVSYCLPYSTSHTTDSEKNSCPSTCSSIYGCSSVFCLDCSNCASYSCEFSSSSLTCLDIQLQCSINQFYNSLTFACENCYNECYNCSNSLQCLICIDSHSVPHTNVGCVCADGYFNTTALTADGVCEKCHQDCKKCEIDQMCTQCLDPYAVPASVGCECIGKYFKGPLGCTQCYSDCSSCNKNLICDTCIAQNSTPSDAVGCVCDQGYYNTTTLDSLESCVKCYKDCLSCNSSLICLDCITTYAVADSIQGCVCSDGYYNSSELTNATACIPCFVDCLTCSEYSTCTLCKDPVGIISSAGCICPDSYYKLTSGYCEKCGLDCYTCDSDTTCLTCLDSNALPSALGCLCIQGFYNSSTTSQLLCQKCPDSCFECSDYNKCSICAYKNMSLVDGNCECPTNSKVINGQCVCDEGFDMKEGDENIFACRVSYNNSRYFKCQENCSICENSTYCKICKDSNPNLFKGTCFGNCSKMYFFNKGKCDRCPKLCIECSSNCTVCEKNAILNEGFCECEKGFKEDGGKCVDSYFNASLSISITNNILISFSEPTEVSLAEDDFLFWVEKDPIKNSDVFKVKLLKNKKNYEYLFSLYSKSDIKRPWVLDVKINKNLLFSFLGSKLFDYTLDGKLFPTKTESSLLSQLLNSTKAATKITVSSSLGSAIVSSPGPAWSLLNTIQIISYLPLSSNPLTSTLIEFFTAFSSYNIVPNGADYIFKQNATSGPYLESRRYGILTSVFFINFGSNALIFIFVIITWPVLAFVAKYTNGKISKKALKILKNYKFNFFIRFWLQAYLDIGIFSLIQLRAVRIT